MGTVMGTAQEARREYGTGTIFQRGDGMWIGRIEAGWDAKGDRRRVQVSAKTEAECKRRLVKKRRQLDTEGAPAVGVSDRATVKAWADTWLTARQSDLRATTWATYAGQVHKWIVPTIGHKRLADLTPGDLRAVTKAETNAGNAVSSARQTRRCLVKMLRDAVVEGHRVPMRIFQVKAPLPPDSDRADIPLPDAHAILDAALSLPDRSRWVAGLLQGIRQSEALGLRWEDIDLEAGLITFNHQLGTLPYADRAAGTFRHPSNVRPIHLWKSYHLLPVKTRKGNRVIPLIPPMRWALDEWREQSPESPHGLVWPRADGKPRNPQHDTNTWVALQDAAQVAHVEGAQGRRYDGHEMRHTTATLLLDAGVDPEVIKAILGHSSIVTSRSYQHVAHDMTRDAIEKVATRLNLTTPSALAAGGGTPALPDADA